MRVEQREKTDETMSDVLLLLPYSRINRCSSHTDIVANVI
jgi:hypothetical protein